MIREYYTDQRETTSLVIEDGKIKAFKSKNITEKSIRVFDESKQVFALAAGVGDIDDAELERKACELLSLNMPYKYELEKDTQADFTKDKLNITDIEAFTQRFLTDLNEICSDFVLSGTARISTLKNILRNDFNLKLSNQKRYLICNLGLKLKGSGNIDDAYTSTAGFDISPQKYDDVLKSTELICKACRSKEHTLNNGSYKILFDSNNILQKMDSDICGEPYETKSSLLAGKLGEQVFHPNININESHEYEDYVMFLPYDDEGILRLADLPIVENGVLKNILYDKKTAQKYGKISTGNGFRSYNTNPSTSTMALVFPDITTLASSLISDDTVILPLISSGGDFLPNGNYSLPVQLALVFKNGVFMGKAPQLSITGNYLETLNRDFIAVGKNDIVKEMGSSEFVYANANVVLQ